MPTSWKVWILRQVATVILVVATAYGVSFLVADYVTDKALAGYKESIGTLTQTTTTLQDHVTEFVAASSENSATNKALTGRVQELTEAVSKTNELISATRATLEETNKSLRGVGIRVNMMQDVMMAVKAADVPELANLGAEYCKGWFAAMEEAVYVDVATVTLVNGYCGEGQKWR